MSRVRARRPRHSLLAAAAALALVGLSTLAGPATAAVDEDQLTGGDFTGGPGAWWVTPDLEPADTTSGALCVEVPGGTTNPWSSIVGIDGLTVEEGESYRLLYTVSGTTPAPIRVLVQLGSSPWTAAYETNPIMTADPRPYEVGFTSAMDIDAGQLVFQIGAADEDWTFCLDDVAFGKGAPVEPYAAETHSAVRVNQLGYLPSGPKRASVMSESEAALTWVLADETGSEVATGNTLPRGFDRTAGASVHIIDFTDAAASGDGFTLTVDGETSHPFRIADDVYAQLPIDALKYFYLARSGIEIDAALVGDEYARAAGHIGVAPNQGDTEVGCQAPRAWNKDWTCDYTLDVTGGWYDAGDHGKYVVNGGIAVHQLLDIAERNGLGDPDVAAESRYGDESLNIPESSDGVPDVLSEARWELEWMLRMQVPAGLPLAGMVHHKVQDAGWTGLPMLPADDPQERQLHRPSTAATLNLAAVAAKGARLFAAYDEAFADELLAAAEIAWDAALAEPDLYAVSADGNEGGGPYDDDDVSDEFFWAAAELWLTTAGDEYAQFLTETPAAQAPLAVPGAFDWGNTAALGHIDLARASMVDADAPQGAASAALIVTAADRLLTTQTSVMFGQPYSRTDGEFEWGSNSIILNNAAILATAHDLTGEAPYRDGVIEAMDYIFGRNAIDRSYVTGYGASFSQNQHSRWMAAQLDPSLPHPPVGTLAGGANSAIQDPVAARTWPDGCPAQLCYLDDIQSWSTNEMTVNWNSALAWVGAWVADDADQDAAASGSWIPWVIGGAIGAVVVGGGVTWAFTRRRTAD